MGYEVTPEGVIYPAREREVVYSDSLMHYGVGFDDNPPGRGSGRYPKGSGKNPYQHGSVEYGYMNGKTSQEFLDYIKMLRKGYTDEDGTKHPPISDSEIALVLGFTRENKKTGETEGDAQLLQRRLEYLNEESRNSNRAKVMTIQSEHPEYYDEETGKWSPTLIAKALGLAPSQESTVRGWLESIDEERNFKIANTAEVLKKALEENKLLTVGTGTAESMGITETKLRAAIQKLVDEEGYVNENIYIPQPNDPLKNTTINVLAPPGTTYKDIYNNKGYIRPVVGYVSEDDGTTFNEYGLRTPASVDSSRVEVLYADSPHMSTNPETGKMEPDGTVGADRDGLIELRPGLDELSLGGKAYAQVRIAVDGTHYIKGMAVYNPDLPEGIDIRFNSNKSSSIPIMGDSKDNTVLKLMKDDPQNPFGSMLKTEDGVVVGQRDYTDPVTGEKKLSPINICRDEGDWEDWSKSLPSQMWSKQTTDLAKRQLDWSVEEKRAELEEIKSLSNPEMRRALLDEFAENCDTAAVNLKAAAMPRQTTSVIIPIPSLKDNEIYAPGYEDGEEVICIRYPHAGTFEIPHLYVNNKNKEAQKIIGTTPIDAVGLPKEPEVQLSGADNDGDTIVIIPLRGQEKLLKYKPMLEQLKGFSTDQYAKSSDQIPTGPKKNGGDGFNTQREMGIITNLIMDMTLKEASEDELARADKHSMVVIDAEKHNLDHAASYRDNNILELKKKYQVKEDGKYGGAGTLITRAKSETHPLHRRQVYSRELMTEEEKERYDRGEIIYRNSGKTKLKKNNKTGEWERVEARINSTRMADTDDAYTLITGEGYDMEKIGAEYANTMKAMANEARRESRSTTSTKVNAQAKTVYAKEVAELKADIAIAKANKPKEQTAQAMATAAVQAKLKEHPEWREDKDKVKKMKNQTLTEMRRRVGANKKGVYVRLDARKIEAMNAGALSSSNIIAVINNCDKDEFKRLALPRGTNALSASDQLKIRHLVEASKGKKNGYTIDEIAKIVGCSASSVKKYAKGK